jgi:ribosomal RNA-processing protein 9
VKHRQSVTAICLSDDDSKGFSASKDGTILHWDVDSGKAEKYQWPNEEILRSHGSKNPEGRATKHSRNVLALSVSTDGRYLASGGLDRHVHLWDTRTREHIQVDINFFFSFLLDAILTEK